MNRGDIIQLTDLSVPLIITPTSDWADTTIVVHFSWYWLGGVAYD